jgi:hypothetical protein
MRKIISFSVAAFLLQVTASSQNISYDAASIPEVIKKGADVVKRYENSMFTIWDIDKTTLNVHQVITVMNVKGQQALIFNQYTSKLVSLDDAEIKVYDAAGKQISRYKKKEMNTVATGEGLIEDGYVTYFKVPAASYPLTVEYKYELKFKGTLFYPSYHILRPDQGVEYSSFTVKTPKELDLRYKEKNIKLSPVVSEDGRYKLYQWSVKNLAPIEDEEGAVSYESRYPSIQLAPNRFYLYGYEGDLSSWKNFGQWLSDLYKGTDELPEERKVFFRNLVKDATNDRGKAKLIYQYLQQNFRYVSIQLGIGGLKPFSAEFTDKKKYGDCKALSNYIKAALKAVDVKSYVAIINSDYDSEAADPSFPSNHFNHVILCIPQPKDSIWLECTSKTNDFAVLGSFTENRNALLVTDNGGALVPTPASRSRDNKLQTTTVITLDEEGRGKTNTLFHTLGEFKERMNYMLTEKTDDQKEFIVYALGFKQPDNFAFTKKEDPSSFTTALEMDIEKIPEFTAGNKMFLRPRMNKLWKTKLPKAENRKLDYYFEFPFEKSDTTVIKLPDNFVVDALPKPKQLSCAYATYNTAYWFDEKQKAVYSTATMVLKQHRIPVAGYNEVKKMFDEILMDDTQRIVVRK